MDFVTGRYKDTLRKGDAAILATEWRANSIQPDFGRFFAALLKKDFGKQVGIEYLLVGGPMDPSSPTAYAHPQGGDYGFRDRVCKYFRSFESVTVPTPKDGAEVLPSSSVDSYWSAP